MKNPNPKFQLLFLFLAILLVVPLRVSAMRESHEYVGREENKNEAHDVSALSERSEQEANQASKEDSESTAAGVTFRLDDDSRLLLPVPAPRALTLQHFRDALEAHPDAQRFRINNIAGVRSLEALEDDSTRGISRNENLDITSTLRDALALEYSGIDVGDFFVVNPMTTLTSYPSLSAQRLRILFERIDRVTAPHAAPVHEDDASLA